MVRMFKIGARTIAFPLPEGSLQENVDQMKVNYPAFRWTDVLESDARPQADGSLIYELQLPPAKANG